MRLVADRHLIGVPLSSVPSGAVSLRDILLVIFMAELKSWGGEQMQEMTTLKPLLKKRHM